MPCYLFTLHSYRSWNADNPRGFVQTGRGVQPPNYALARSYDRHAKQNPIEFSHRHQATMTWIALDACRKRGRKRVRDRKHFDHLLTKYLPKHRGFIWKEGDHEPNAPKWAVDGSTKPPASAGG